MSDALVRSGLSFVTRPASPLLTFLCELFVQTEPMQQSAVLPAQRHLLTPTLHPISSGNVRVNAKRCCRWKRELEFKIFSYT